MKPSQEKRVMLNYFNKIPILYDYQTALIHSNGQFDFVNFLEISQT